eukprot:TRINITY_DN1114_c0_g1_i2.p1 TRINITY_DN1114_c0_g1~~TRINITY_DN1114_c0_g1_i2.p1  ORF type:complete len:791 (-),score=199.94 TRINITY_DN1114_c0_g1_i2:246-2618(-)
MMLHDKEARELLPFATCSPSNLSPSGGPGLFLFVSDLQQSSNSATAPVSHVIIGEGSSDNLKSSVQTSQQLLQGVTTQEMQPELPFLFEKLDGVLATLRSPVDSSSDMESVSVVKQLPKSTAHPLLTATPLLDSESKAKAAVVTLTDCTRAKGLASRMIERVGSLMPQMQMSETLGGARSQPLVETIGESLYLETEDEENRKLTGKESKIEMMVKTPLKVSVQLELRDLSYEVEVQTPQPTWQTLFSSLRGSSETTGRKQKKTLLQHISLQIEPGDFVAIMGPTGCGKTTLLNILSGRVRSGVKGSILVNGKKLSKDIKRSTAYVMQDDILFSFLTVNDTLNVTAELRLSKIADPEERLKRTREIVSALNLVKCQNTKIGNQWVRGVSGGERKRVNIANELITNPSLVLLDEPTSGLDSSTSLSLIETIGDIAASGRTVITTIHQPSSQMFEKFDKLLLLADGRIIYFGRASDALNYFASLGHFSPPNYNPADFFMGLVLDEELKGGEAIRASLIEAYEKKAASSAHILPSKQIEDANKDDSSDDDEDGINSKYGADYLQQVRILLWRTAKQSIGELDIFNYLQVIFISIIIGILWWQIGDTEAQINDRAGALFFIVSFVGGFFPLFNALSAFPRERPIIIRERSSGTYHLSSYFLAKWINEFPHVISFPILLMCIVYWMVGFEKNEAFLWSTLAMCLSALTSSAMGLLFSIWITNFKTVMTFTSVIVLSLMLVGGFYIKSYNLPGWIAWLRYLSWIKYSFEVWIVYDSFIFDHPAYVYSIDSNETSIPC